MTDSSPKQEIHKSNLKHLAKPDNRKHSEYKGHIKILEQISGVERWGNFSSVQFSHSVMSNSWWPHEMQHTRPPCPSPTRRVHTNSFPLSQRCHLSISSSVVPFSFCLWPFPASGYFQMSQLFASDGKIIDWSFSFNISPSNQSWTPRTDLL